MAYQDDCRLPRRKFLQGLVVAPVVWGVGDSEVSSPTKNSSRVPMLQTWADATTSLVVVLGKPGWQFSANLNNPHLKVTLLKADALTGSGQVLYRLHLEGLSPQSYSQMVISDQNKKNLDVRSLKGLDLDLANPKIAVISCSNYRELKSQDKMYLRMEEELPDLNLFIGDIVYSNSRWSSIRGTPEDPATALGRYIETWNKLGLYRMEPLLPCLSIWDDHDYGTNNGDSSHPYKNEMKEIYRTFYPLPPSHERLSFGPGLAFRLRAFGIDFHMLDGRSFKVDNDTQWGAEQEDWFAQDYAASKNPAWILNGTQFFNYFRFSESVEKDAAPSLKKLQNLVRKTQKPAAFFSGDVHSSQLQELKEPLFGFKTFEITSSAIHSSSLGDIMKRKPEDGQLFYYSKSNFILIRPEIKKTGMELSLSCATESGTYPIANAPFKIAV